MIARIWSARLDSANVGEYFEHFERHVRPHLESLDGFIEAAVMARESADRVREVIVESRWKSMNAVSAFAGSDVTTAVIDPAAIALFIDYDRTVRHYRILRGSSVESR